MQQQKPVCNLDNTWEDVLDAFKSSIVKESTWSCHTLDGLDKEVILSAPEIMDPKTDSGFGYEKVSSLAHLLQNKEIPSVANLSEEAEVEILDYLLSKELAYLQGKALTQSYLSFPYLFRMEELKNQNATLYAYSRGVLRCLDCMLQVVFSTTIRSEEEFVSVPPELDRQSSAPTEEILADLETAAARAKSPALAARLRFRHKFLSIMKLLIDAKRRHDVEAACAICDEAVQLLESSDFARSAEPAPLAKLMREEEISFWVSVITPTKPIPAIPFAEVLNGYKTALGQLASFRTLLTSTSLNAVLDYILHLGAAQPLLFVRCTAAVVMAGRDPGESFLYGVPLHQRLLEMLAKEYGAPLYLKIFEKDEAMIESVVKYRIHRTMDPLKVTPNQIVFLREQTVDMTRRWAMEACRFYLLLLETMLCNRGLAHRRLMNLMTDLAKFQEQSYSLDLTVYLAGHSGVTGETEADCVKCSTVLTLFANDYLLRTMEMIMSFEVELDLLTQAELVPALWYINFAQRAQMENLSGLYLNDTRFIPETRINKRTKVPLHNLALTTRTAGAPDATRLTLLDVASSLTDATYLSACLFEKMKLIDLQSGAAHSLTTPEDIFNHRLLLCYGQLRSPPLRAYDRCLAAKPVLNDESKLPVYAKKAAEVATAAAVKAKTVMTAPAVEDTRRESLRAQATALEKTSRMVAASLLAFAAASENADGLKDYHATVERPAASSMLVFSFHKK